MERRHHRRYNRSIVHKVRPIYVLLLFSIDEGVEGEGEGVTIVSRKNKLGPKDLL